MSGALRLQTMPTLAEKLRLARLAIGLSTRAVAERLSSRLGISHTSIANYESGRSSPKITILAVLAELYQRPLNWFLDRGPSLTGIQYRNLKSKVRVRDRHVFEGEAQKWLDAYIRLEERISRPLKPQLRPVVPKKNEEPHELALRVRSLLGLESQIPLASVVEVLELFGIRVLELETGLSIDGMAARYGSEYVVILNPNVPNDRSRLNAAHELGHILYGDCREGSTINETAAERRAFDFASNLIMPNSVLKDAFVGHSMVRLVQFKERFGLSLAAMVYRAEKVGFITKDSAKRLWIDFARRGWKSNEPGVVRPDRATRFEQLLDESLMSEQLTLAQVANLAQAREDELRNRLRMAMGIDRFAETEEDPNDDGVIPLRIGQ